jgi:hypothetical protein
VYQTPNYLNNITSRTRMQAVKMTTEAAAKIFFTSSHFAVVGASSDPTKFGHKSELILIPFT